MSMTITFVVSMMAILLVTFTIGQDVKNAYVTISSTWLGQENRWESQSNTRIAGPIGASVDETTTVQLTLVNEGDEVVGDFEHWNLIIESQRPGSPAISYLTYTENGVPGPNEWTVSGIYRDADTLAAEVVDPGIMNSGEEMIVVANPSPAIVAGFYDRAVFVTPNGVSLKVIFKVSAVLYVADRDDGLVYIYMDDGTYSGVDFLDSNNDDARGITTDNTNFWTVDVQDLQANRYPSTFNVATPWTLDLANATSTGITTDGTNIWTVDPEDDVVYQYDMVGTSVSNFTLDPTNAGATGITTDGSSIWTVDDQDNAVYKYSMAGVLDSSFPLTSGNADPTGITTNGTQIWVVDHADLKIYSYITDGTYLTTLDISLTAPNADPEGITVRSK
ncbi:MAG: hypothetical protein O2821_06450 [Chloroflexi bacterium]|nr:hypothetical protein [Chloroflexota bacterium]MDA1228710.1 hypothetical protein [Chloroflexota bacterium]